MPEEFEGDLAGAVFWGADLRGAQFRDVDLSETTITHSRLVDVTIDAYVERVVINGVDVTAFVNAGDEWYPLRARLRPVDPAAMRATWEALEAEWARTIEQARALPEPALHESVGGEWSFVQTLRHVVFAIDKWATVPLLGGTFHPIGLPNSGSVDFPWPDLDPSVRPSPDEGLTVLRDRFGRVRRYLEDVRVEVLGDVVDILENGPNPTIECLFTVFEEAFWHNRYARRDLAALDA